MSLNQLYMIHQMKVNDALYSLNYFVGPVLDINEW